MGRKIAGLSPRAADQLLRYDWPGNVRELENAMERAVALARGSRLDLDDLPEEIRQVFARPVVNGETVQPLRDVEKEYILAVLELNDGNQRRTAEQLQIGSATLYRDRLAGVYEPEALDAAPAGARRIVAFDLDNDARTDLLTTGEDGITWLRNQHPGFTAVPLGGGGGYVELPMINAVGDQYTVNIPAMHMAAPGVEYYLEATDGASVTQHGTPAAPHQVTVQDVPVVLSVDPTSGTFAGGDVVTITGSNFVDPPVVRFGGTASPAVTFVSATELTAETPAHYPALVDVEVENPSTAVGRLTNAYTLYTSP